MKYKLVQGDMLKVLKRIKDNTIDVIITDPPYELKFMNNKWDGTEITFKKETWAECLRVLKPGGLMSVFHHSKKFHRCAVAIEDAGFELKDTLMWIYGTGFPKAQDIAKHIDKLKGTKPTQGDIKSNWLNKDGSVVDRKLKGHDSGNGHSYGFDDAPRETTPTSPEAKKWQGYKTPSLKPAFEPIILAQKPIEGTYAKNVLKWGVGAFNIDACRVVTGDSIAVNVGSKDEKQSDGWGVKKQITEIQNKGRYPANVLHDGSKEVVDMFPRTKSGYNLPHYGKGRDKDKVSLFNNFESKTGGYGDDGSASRFFVNTGAKKTPGTPYIYKDIKNYTNSKNSMFKVGDKPQAPSNYNDSGSVARFFYSAKANSKDRDDGVPPSGTGKFKCQICKQWKNGSTHCRCAVPDFKEVELFNTHPTVKPTKLMQWLIKLLTPPEGIILDPFVGSGSTGKATAIVNRELKMKLTFVGIDKSQAYLDISEARIKHEIKGE